MACLRSIAPDIHYVGAVDWNRRLFDALIPLPDGTSYNAYLVKGSEKTALIDTVDPSMWHLMDQLLDKSCTAGLDYVVIQHCEQDHAGSLPLVLKKFPSAKVVCNKACKDLLIAHLHIAEERFELIEDGGTLSLGNRTLLFKNTPWVHWPQTFVTFLREDKILFSCDFFGSHLASSALFFEAGDQSFYEPCKRYFAEIMLPFRKIIQKNMDIVRELNPLMIAPSHGPIFKDPSMVMGAYAQWIDEDQADEVMVAYVSMHDSTRLMAEELVQKLMDRGLKVKVFDLVHADLGKVAEALVDAKVLLLGSPTVLAGAHPLAAQAAFLVNALRPKIRYAGVFGSFGWGGKMVEQIAGMLSGLKLELLSPVMVKGLPRREDYQQLDAWADQVVEKIKL